MSLNLGNLARRKYENQKYDSMSLALHLVLFLSSRDNSYQNVCNKFKHNGPLDQNIM